MVPSGLELRSAKELWQPSDLSVSGANFGENLRIVGFVEGNNVIGAIFFPGVDPGALAHFAPPVGARQDFQGVLRSSGNISRFDQITVHAVFNNFRQSADTR